MNNTEFFITLQIEKLERQINELFHYYEISNIDILSDKHIALIESMENDIKDLKFLSKCLKERSNIDKYFNLKNKNFFCRLFNLFS
jgi:enoyl-[acyl-carrier-protein] reductase (NADH)